MTDSESTITNDELLGFIKETAPPKDRDRDRDVCSQDSETEESSYAVTETENESSESYETGDEGEEDIFLINCENEEQYMRKE